MKEECAEFETNPKRRKIMLFIDTTMPLLKNQVERRWLSLRESPRSSASTDRWCLRGCGGSVNIMNAQDDLRKVSQLPTLGLRSRAQMPSIG